MEIIRPVRQGPLLSYPLCARLQAAEVQGGKPPARPMQVDYTGRASLPAPMTGEYIVWSGCEKKPVLPLLSFS